MNNNYEERYYRSYIQDKKTRHFNITIFESDLEIYTDGELKMVMTEALLGIRQVIENYITRYPHFKVELTPIPVLPGDPEMIQHMKAASKKLNVGPMATVAGAVAHYLGDFFSKQVKELIIENGGDLYVYSTEHKKILLHSGRDSKINNLAIEINKNDLPIGICTSSGRLGHSTSYGHCDAVTVLAKDTLIADAAATAFGNMLKNKSNIKEVLTLSQSFKELDGVIAILDNEMGAWGSFQFV